MAGSPFPLKGQGPLCLFCLICLARVPGEVIVPEIEKILRGGRTIPSLGLHVSDAEHTVGWATRFGIRMLDISGNQSAAGQAIRLSSTPRSRLFLSVKLFDHGFQEAHRAIRQSLRELRVDYVDLYMMASPSPGKIIETWDAMIEIKKMGLARILGVQNFGVSHLEALRAHERELPEVLQLRLNPFTVKKHQKLLDWSRQHGLLVQSVSPFHGGQIFRNSAFQALDLQGRSLAQVLLRWGIQMDFQVIQHSLSKDHLQESTHVWTFNLTEGEMRTISMLGEMAGQEDTSLAGGDGQANSKTGFANHSIELAQPATVEL
mmetsp:Transcript_40712/g.75773  ORF Transcript_40712/g.75773 Transcript_40712/m.75773 type:complete len:318 (+) Transcript_40712:30-983(+)